eukprot:m.179074 g.179074  ORF g.179074 m.179074 type:complete len:522 (+) comp31955_c0_seq2:38-1603(+)
MDVLVTLPPSQATSTLDETSIGNGIISNREQTHDSDSVSMESATTLPIYNEEPSTHTNVPIEKITTIASPSRLSLKERLKLRKAQQHLQQEQEVLQQLELDGTNNTSKSNEGNGTPSSPKDVIINAQSNTIRRNQSSSNKVPTTVKSNGRVDADSLYITATMLCKQRKFLKAETVCRRALKLDPKHKDIIFRLAGLMLPKDLAASERLYRDALSIDPNSAKFMTHLAKVLSALKRNEEAEVWYRQALVVSPKDPVAPLMLATLLRGRGKNDEAEMFCRRAVSQAPLMSKRKAQAMFILANLLTEKGELYVAEAEECYRNVLEIEPTNEGALNNLAVLFKEKGQKEDAEELYRRALKHNNDHVPTMHNLANLLRGYGEYSEAEKFSRRCLELDRNHIGSLKNVCLMLEMREEYDESDKLRRHLFACCPNDAHNLVKLARLAMVKGELTEAETFCRMALDVDPRETTSHVLVKVLEAKEERLCRLALDVDPREMMSSVSEAKETKDDDTGAQIPPPKQQFISV